AKSTSRGSRRWRSSGRRPRRGQPARRRRPERGAPGAANGDRMDFGWSPEARQRLSAAQRFAAERLQPRTRAAGLDREAWQQAASFGAFGAVMAQRDGGRRRGGALDSAALFEALG